ncbi:MAG: hypothetical protein IPO93_13025 [Actinobacteria bacterium]|nr:hypothetical protein [Actinomycetota bacterium]
MANTRATLTVALSLTFGLALAGCSSSTGTEATTAAASAAPSSAAAASGTPASDAPSSAAASSNAPASGTQWCVQYAAIASQLSAMTGTQENAVSALPAVDDFDQLWADAADTGFLTADEADANRRVVANFKVILTLIAAGAAADSTEVQQAQVDMEAATKKDDALLRATDTKVTALCNPLGASSSASPSPASS